MTRTVPGAESEPDPVGTVAVPVWSHLQVHRAGMSGRLVLLLVATGLDRILGWRRPGTR